MEDNKNYPNRYYFLRKLEEKGLVEKITVVNDKAEYLYCLTGEGNKIVDGSEAFNELIELKERIESDNKIKKLISKYSKTEFISNEKKKIKLFETSQILQEKDDVVKVFLYGREFVNLSKEEIESIDSIARGIGKFTQSDIR